MAIKKTFIPLVEHLQNNLKAKVSDVVEDIIALASTKARVAGTGASTTLIKNTEGDVVAILDYYFKRWMPLIGDNPVEFGKKASSASGYSSMSKAGTSLWTKQQQEAKKAITNILIDIEEGTLEISAIAERKAEIEAVRKEIAETELGFATQEECAAYLSLFCDMDKAEAEAEVEVE